MIYRLYKIENFFYRIKLIPIAFLIRLLMRIIFSCDISYKCKIGKNCNFPHYALGCVIHQDAIIGNNCKILHGVTIGGKSNSNRLPIIGDNVIIGANSVIIGNVKVGNNAIIGASSVVLRDVGENSIVAGNPAKKISNKKGNENAI